MTFPPVHRISPLAIAVPPYTVTPRVWWHFSSPARAAAPDGLPIAAAGGSRVIASGTASSGDLAFPVVIVAAAAILSGLTAVVTVVVVVALRIGGSRAV